MTINALRSGTVAQAIRAHRLVVVLRRLEPRQRLVALVEELAEAGARAFEVTFDAPAAVDDVAALRDALAARPDGPFLVGAGTITDAGRLERAVGAGVDFGVAPALDRAIVRAAVEADLPFVPGAYTPTEVAEAWAAGAALVKLFPASAAGPSFVRELRGPMPEVPILATGGIDATNAVAFLEAGAAAVGIGGALVRADAGERRSLLALVAGAAR